MENVSKRTNNRMVLLLVAGVPVIMILSASWLWYFVVRGDLDLIGVLGTANRGILVQPPRQINEAALREPGGVAFAYSNLEPKWTMVIPGAVSRCDTICENSLYLTRQIHIGLGKEFNRVRRFYVSATEPQNTQFAPQASGDREPVTANFATFLGAEHRDLRALVLEPQDMGKLFPEFPAEPSSWYLVDPSGWIMMSYNKDISYKDVIADLKFLLKNSGD